MAIMLRGMLGRVRGAVCYILHGEMPKPVVTGAGRESGVCEWHEFDCRNQAKHRLIGMNVCGVHKNVILHDAEVVGSYHEDRFFKEYTS